ncbi:MAG: GAF domain-containing protein [Phycisphaerales bacterium]|nr:GAF domain-containing protein [Phycisphaerales bacterium]
MRTYPHLDAPNMAARKAKSAKECETRPVAKAHQGVLVLVAHPVRARREMIVRSLTGFGYECRSAPTAACAEASIGEGVGSILLMAESIADEIPSARSVETVILLCEKTDTRAARRALELRCDDFADEKCEPNEFESMFLRAAAARGSASARERRLRGLCRKLNASRRELSNELTRLCSEMTESYAELAGKIDTVAIAGEFTGLIRQEIELESLMRTSLEFLLAKLGSTNAALFLPSSSGDWTLGAYVNYDRAKDSAEMMLDHLADTVPCRMDEIGSTVLLEGEAQVKRALPGAVEWLGDCTVLAAPAAHEGETLACVLLFRDRSVPFPEHARETLESLSKILASQFGRVIKVHHRHLPREEWASPGDPFPSHSEELEDQDDRDLLA